MKKFATLLLAGIIASAFLVGCTPKEGDAGSTTGNAASGSGTPESGTSQPATTPDATGGETK